MSDAVALCTGAATFPVSPGTWAGHRRHECFVAKDDGKTYPTYPRSEGTDARAWGGLVGLLRMTGYFATLLPKSSNHIVAAFSR
jgi:hypothetical protein